MQRERYDHSRAFFGLTEAARRWRCRFPTYFHSVHYHDIFRRHCSCFEWSHISLQQHPGILSLLQCKIHTLSAIAVIILVFFVDLHHFICKHLILPGGVFMAEMIVKCLSCNLQSLAVKTDPSCDPTVISLFENELKPFFFPDFRRFAAKKADVSSRNSFSSSSSRFFFSSSFIRVFAAWSLRALLPAF